MIALVLAVILGLSASNVQAEGEAAATTEEAPVPVATAQLTSILPPEKDPVPLTEKQKAKLATLRTKIEEKLTQESLEEYKRVELEKLKRHTEELEANGSGNWTQDAMALENGLIYVENMIELAKPIEVTEFVKQKSFIKAGELFKHLKRTPASNLVLAIKRTPEDIALMHLWSNPHQGLPNARNRDAYEYAVVGTPEHILSDTQLQPLPAMMRYALENIHKRRSPEAHFTHDTRNHVRFIAPDGSYHCYEMGNLTGWFKEIEPDKISQGERQNLASLGIKETVSALPAFNVPGKVPRKEQELWLRYQTLIKSVQTVTETPVHFVSAKVPTLREGVSIKKAYIGFGDDFGKCFSLQKAYGNQTSLAWYTDPEGTMKQHIAYGKEVKRLKERSSYMREHANDIFRRVSKRYAKNGKKYQCFMRGTKRPEKIDGFFIYLFHKHVNKVSSKADELGIENLLGRRETKYAERSKCKLLYAHPESTPGAFRQPYFVVDGVNLREYEGANPNNPAQPIAYGYGPDFDALLVKKEDTDEWKESPVMKLYESKARISDLKDGFNWIQEWQNNGKPKPPVIKKKKKKWYEKIGAGTKNFFTGKWGKLGWNQL